jgi:hypothetical protein
MNAAETVSPTQSRAESTFVSRGFRLCAGNNRIVDTVMYYAW